MPEAIAGAEFSLGNLASSLSLEGLTQLGPDGRALPRLAESWSWQQDGLSLVVNLRNDVQFHDGTPLNAEFAASFYRDAISRPANRMLYVSFSDVRDVQPRGDRQIIFLLSRPNAFLPDDLVLEIGRGGAGTGPYRTVKNEPTEVVLASNDRYYLGSPQISQIVIRPFATLRTAWSSLLRGEVDMVTEVPPDAVDFVRNDTVQVISFDRRYQYLVAFNSRKKPFSSRAVRRALSSAIDRDAVVQRVLHGQGTSSIGPVWSQHWAYDRSLPGTRYDPGLTESLLEAAGFTEQEDEEGRESRLRFTCLIPENFSVIERIGLEVQKQLYDVGIDMRFETVRPEELNERIRRGDFDSILMELLSGPTLGRAYMFWGSSKSFQGLNVFGYENPDVERMFGVLRGARNEGAIRSATRGLQQALTDDPPALFIAWNKRSRAVRSDFQVVQDPGRDPVDPVFTIWRWAPRSTPAAQ